MSSTSDLIMEQAQELHVAAQALEEKGLDDEAIEKYKEAIKLNPEKSESYYNIGLIYKSRNDWQNSFEFNKKANELDPDDEAARWNLAIAATALRDWLTVRRAWKDQGLDIDNAEGPIELDFGLTPVRLNPNENGEVVLARRIDPVRARIGSIPLPDSNFCCGDIVLHDGAAVGYRMLGERKCAVFNVMELYEASKLSTFQLLINMPTQIHVDDLSKTFGASGIEMEDWTSNIRSLCKACSEGDPHDHHDHEEHQEWKSERKIGIAATSIAQVDEILQRWISNGVENSSQTYRLTCVLQTLDRSTVEKA